MYGGEVYLSARARLSVAVPLYCMGDVPEWAILQDSHDPPWALIGVGTVTLKTWRAVLAPTRRGRWGLLGQFQPGAERTKRAAQG